ncbi:CCC motif membrane protein [Lacinutrix gracilariae]|uniref:CCC motif membrane protein n=1 Tax=Lacinutrix gracilariae TaxID=1747198 RepID=A0ABW5K2J7_9FLAO
MNQNRLPADSSAMTLGIIAIVILFLGCCCGLFSIVSVVLSIIGLVSANKSLRLFSENTEVYSSLSYTNVKNAKVLNIIALVLSAMVTLLYLAYFMIYGVLLTTILMDAYEENGNDSYYEWENDSLYYEEDDMFEIESDSIIIDSISIRKYKEIVNTQY